METLSNGTEEYKNMLNESVHNMTLVVDKLAYHVVSILIELFLRIKDWLG